MRCSICDATHDGKMTDVPYKRSRQFNIDQENPHLYVCSDCSVFGRNQTPTEDVLPGEVPTVEPLWDD